MLQTRSKGIKQGVLGKNSGGGKKITVPKAFK